MNTSILATNPENFIFASNDDLRTTSLKVAEAFGKLHKDVLRKIQTLDCSPEFNQRNFAPVEYVDAKGEKRAAYEMTKDGFMFLVMGFTGKAAAQIKEAYINAFNLMHDKLFPKVKPRLLSELTDEERWKMVVERWLWLIDIYGSQMTNQYGNDIPQVWEDVLGNLTTAQFKRGIEAIKNSASPYMPKLPVFIAYCKDAEVVTAKEGLTISEMKEKLGLPCENREDILKHVEFQDVRIKVCVELLQGMKHSAEIMKSRLAA